MSAVPVTTVVAGVDSSTQATKVELRDLATGEVVGGASAPHPSVTPPVSEQHPDSWWRAFERAWADATAQLPVGAVVAGISVAGQQHGMVALDAETLGDALGQHRHQHDGFAVLDEDGAAGLAGVLARLDRQGLPADFTFYTNRLSFHW